MQHRRASIAPLALLGPAQYSVRRACLTWRFADGAKAEQSRPCRAARRISVASAPSFESCMPLSAIQAVSPLSCRSVLSWRSIFAPPSPGAHRRAQPRRNPPSQLRHPRLTIMGRHTRLEEGARRAARSRAARRVRVVRLCFCLRLRRSVVTMSLLSWRRAEMGALIVSSTWLLAWMATLP